MRLVKEVLPNGHERESGRELPFCVDIRSRVLINLHSLQRAHVEDGEVERSARARREP